MRDRASVVASEVHKLSPSGAQLVAPDSCGFDSRARSFHFGESRLVKSKMNGLRMYVIADFATAIQFGATHIRVGSAIFGTR